ncbi:MAG: AmmeMemoRadiSam system radical SAM enzyme, partial [Endomicrobiales bacterium]
CNFRCGFCQNWQISQTKEARQLGVGEEPMAPDRVVERALTLACRSISYTYTEPTIFFEYAFDISKRAKEKGLANIFVTNGYMTAEALDMIRPYLDAANVDLKYFDDEKYRSVCKAHLQPVLDTIRRMKEAGIWVEVTTLVIPGQNDSDEELGATAAFLAGTGREIPWHLSRFHPDYRFTETDSTPMSTLQRAYDIGKKAGLRYVYIGNVAEEENTCCYRCGELLIERAGFTVVANRLRGGRCPRCDTPLDGRLLEG